MKFFVKFSICWLLIASPFAPAQAAEVLVALRQTDSHMTRKTYQFPNPQIQDKDFKKLQKGEVIVKANTRDLLGGTGIMLVNEPLWKTWKVGNRLPWV